MKTADPKRILSSLKETVVIVFFFFSRIFETLRIRKEIISITMGCSVTVYNPLPVSRIDYELTLFILSYLIWQVWSKIDLWWHFMTWFDLK